MKVCSNCKGIVTDSTNFCPNCGCTDFIPATVLNADDTKTNQSSQKNAQKADRDHKVLPIIGFLLALMPLLYLIFPHFLLSVAGFVGLILSAASLINSYHKDLVYNGLAVAGFFIGMIGAVLFMGDFFIAVNNLR